MLSFGRNTFRATRSARPLLKANPMMQAPLRTFGAMDEINRDLFEHKFTSDMEFQSSFDKIKCFRVLDEEGNVVTPGYDTKISDDDLMKMYDKMVTINEADVVYNAAQRQARISFYMTQLGEEASGIGTAAALKDHDLIFP
jgi:2-oxoisovalerate dehydrogenase E1 component alpha subunit|mmetsp:Transcript_3490/g.4642  ORF Transcript_3490/g.4642 Transcript_3490/m.4642 type:complete len:141 (+) Transcript_3490:55-477(+)